MWIEVALSSLPLKVAHQGAIFDFHNKLSRCRFELAWIAWIRTRICHGTAMAHLAQEALRLKLMTHLALLCFLHVVVVPVSVEPWADDLEIIDDIEREVVAALSLRLPT